jgi:hypothetical protein
VQTPTRCASVNAKEWKRDNKNAAQVQSVQTSEGEEVLNEHVPSRALASRAQTLSAALMSWRIFNSAAQARAQPSTGFPRTDAVSGFDVLESRACNVRDRDLSECHLKTENKS